MDTYNKILHIIEEHIGNTTTDNYQLDKICKQLFNKKWLGCVPLDLIDNNTGYQIINLSKSYESGSHWIACINDGKNKIFYDSFGDLHKLNQNPYIKVLQPTFTEDDTEQMIKESNCGQRCIAWLYLYDNYGLDEAMKI